MSKHELSPRMNGVADWLFNRFLISSHEVNAGKIRALISEPLILRSLTKYPCLFRFLSMVLRQMREIRSCRFPRTGN
jgi:hypothetical protein